MRDDHRVERSSLPEQVAALLHQAIVDGDYAPGQQLPQQKELAHQYGVSLSVAREGLALLTSAGVVTSSHGRGTFVNDSSPALLRFPMWVGSASDWRAVLESTEARYFVERALARLAAQRCTKEELAEMSARLRVMEASSSDAAAFASADVGFHMALARAAHNRLLESSLSSIRQIIGQDVFDHHLHGAQDASPADVILAHRQVLDAVAAADPNAAERAMGVIIERAVNYVRARGATDQVFLADGNSEVDAAVDGAPQR